MATDQSSPEEGSQSERIQVPSGVSRITEFCSLPPLSPENTSKFFEESPLVSPYPVLVCKENKVKSLQLTFPGMHVVTFPDLGKTMYDISLDLLGMTHEAKKLVDVQAYGSLASLAQDMQGWAEQAFTNGVRGLALPITFEPMVGKGICAVNLKVDYLIYHHDTLESIVAAGHRTPNPDRPQYTFRWNGTNVLSNYKKLYVVAVNNP